MEKRWGYMMIQAGSGAGLGALSVCMGCTETIRAWMGTSTPSGNCREPIVSGSARAGAPSFRAGNTCRAAEPESQPAKFERCVTGRAHRVVRYGAPKRKHRSGRYGEPIGSPVVRDVGYSHTRAL